MNGLPPFARAAPPPPSTAAQLGNVVGSWCGSFGKGLAFGLGFWLAFHWIVGPLQP